MSNPADSGMRIVEMLQAIAISPAEAAAIVESRRQDSEHRHPGDSDSEHDERVARAIVSIYSWRAATLGGATALSGVVPGLGSVLAAVGGSMADVVMTMKYQMDMCHCLARVYDKNLTDDEARQLGFLLAMSVVIERAAAAKVTPVASRAGVKLLRRYLRGASLKAVKQMAGKLGLVFTRKGFEKAIPFGIGVLVSGGANYWLTAHVGRHAIKWFGLNASIPK